MIFDFNETKKQNDLVESQLLALKEDYIKSEMSKEQLEKLRAVMEDAKMTDRKEQNKKRMCRFAVTAAALVGAFMILQRKKRF